MGKKKSGQKKVKPESGSIMTVSERVMAHISSFGNIVDEMKIHVIKGKGIRITAVDPAHVMMRDMTIKECPNLQIDNDFEMVVDLDKMKEMLVSVKKDENVAIGFKQNGRIITFAYGHHYHEKEAVDIFGVSDPKIPDLQHPGFYRVSVKSLLATLEQVECLTNHIRLEGDEGNFKIVGVGSTDTYTGNFNVSCEDFDNRMGGSDILVLLSSDYFGTMIRTYDGLKLPYLRIHIRTDYPAIFEVGNDDGDYPFYDRHVIAPRIE